MEISMETTTTTIRGLTFDVLVTETTHRDTVGVFFYLAVITVRSRKTGVEREVRRSRLPGAGKTLARDVQRLGVRALEKLAA
jgi:mRNA-degrading endonuclease toxin of MazEF toxin-antitoxin module